MDPLSSSLLFWRRVKEVFDEIWELEPAARAKSLREYWQTEPAVSREVAHLLDTRELTETFLERPLSFRPGMFRSVKSTRAKAGTSEQ